VAIIGRMQQATSDGVSSPPTPGSCTAVTGVDCHVHVFDTARFPFHPSRGFDILPNQAGTAEQLLDVMAGQGLSHALLVNPLGGYGTDNACMLDVMARFPGRFKGVAVVAHGTSEAALSRMKAAGVAGLRFNLNFPASPSLFDPGAQRTLAVARDLGWFAQVHYEGDTLLAALPVLRASGLPLVIDHMGRPDPTPGAHNRAYEALLELGREGSAVVKLSAAFRLRGTRPPYPESDAIARQLIDAFTMDRCVWGSDWPFLRANGVSYASLLDTLTRWLPDPADRDRVLAVNPVRLFGFGAQRKLATA
jgi:predicted TIM-barrel fold metal-dependent hydrolase